MRSGVAVRILGAVTLPLFALHDAPAAEHPPGEVRVLSSTDDVTNVTVRAEPGTRLEDRTPGAQPASRPRGPASLGQTFAGEITLWLPGFVISRPVAVEVDDALVSSVRMFPEAQGTSVVVFVRQPVSYNVSRPSALGEITIALRGRGQPLQGRQTVGGQTRVVRPKATGGEEVAVDAESLSYDQQTNVLTARGGVTLTRGATTLTADEVRYDRTAGVVEARGQVVITDPEATVEGDSAQINLEDESGWIESADADLEVSGYSVRAGRLVKRGGPRYSVADGVFTTCRCGGLEKPSWSLAGRETDVQVGGFGTVRHATFRVKDIPILYVPYLPFPANTDRQSGLLLPQLGYSNRRGFQYVQPLYWAINKSSDATVALDVETAARIGVVGEYRYMLSRKTRGSFTAAYYNDFNQQRSLEGVILPTGTTPADIPDDRWAVAGRHRQPFVGGSKFYLDAFAVSDVAFLREINSFAFSARRDVLLRTTRFTETSSGVIKTWPNALLWMEGAYYQDLIDPQEVTLQKLPRIEGEYGLPLLGDHLVGRVRAQGTYFWRPEGYDGLRADLAPELFVPLRLGRALSGSISGRLRETAYHLTDTEQVAFVEPNPGVTPVVRFRSASELPRLETNRTRELAEVSGRLGTELSRVFDFRHLGFGKLRHTIEPEVRYLYIPEAGRPTFNVPLPSCATLSARGQRPRPGDNCDATLFSQGFLFDEIDAINRRNFLSYGITTRLFGRGPTAADAAAALDDAEDSQPGDVDPAQLAQGLAAGTVPDFVGPPAPVVPGGPLPPARELLRAQVLQGYDISRELTPDSHLSDVDLGLRFTPLDYLGLLYNATVDVRDPSVLGQTAGFFLREPGWVPPTPLRNFQSPSSLAISYRFVEDNLNQGFATSGPEARLLATQGVQELDGSVYLRLGDYVGFTFLSRFDLSTTNPVPGQELGPHFLERDYFLRLISRCNCWVLDVGLADKFNPNERLFRIQLTLVGLGSFGQGTLPQSSFVGFAPLNAVGYRRPSTVTGASSGP